MKKIIDDEDGHNVYNWVNIIIIIIRKHAVMPIQCC
jgi:hypothetical protein